MVGLWQPPLELVSRSPFGDHSEGDSMILEAGREDDEDEGGSKLNILNILLHIWPHRQLWSRVPILLGIKFQPQISRDEGKGNVATLRFNPCS